MTQIGKASGGGQAALEVKPVKTGVPWGAMPGRMTTPMPQPKQEPKTENKEEG